MRPGSVRIRHLVFTVGWGGSLSAVIVSCNPRRASGRGRRRRIRPSLPSSTPLPATRAGQPPSTSKNPAFSKKPAYSSPWAHPRATRASRGGAMHGRRRLLTSKPAHRRAERHLPPKAPRQPSTKAAAPDGRPNLRRHAPSPPQARGFAIRRRPTFEGPCSLPGCPTGRRCGPAARGTLPHLSRGPCRSPR